MFQKTYKDYIKQWKKAVEEEKKLNESTIDSTLSDSPFPEYTVRLTINQETAKECNLTKYWYKQGREVKFTYELKVFENIPDQKQTETKNTYKELVGHNGWLSSIYGATVTDDFLTGYYFAKYWLSTLSDVALTGFYFGASKRQLHNGIQYYFDSKKKKLTCYYADHQHVKPYYLNGITKSGDLTNLDVLKSIRIQISNVTSDLSYYICDINPKTSVHLYNSLFLALTDLSAKGIAIIRLPSPTQWSTIGNTALFNFLLLATIRFKTVHVFKTPWGLVPRYYLIASNPTKFSSAENVTYYKYLIDLKNNKVINFFHDMLYDDETTIGESLATHITYVNALFDKLIKYEETINTEEANSKWLDTVLEQYTDKASDSSDELSSPKPFNKK